MGQAISLTGDDTIILTGFQNGQLIQQLVTDFATGIVAEITFPEDMVKATRGKNGNTVFALNNQGFQSELKLMVLLAKGTDTFLNAQMAALKQAFSGFVLMGGTFVKNVGDGFGNITPVTYIMSAGMPKKMPGAKTVAEGDVTQSLAEWQIIYANNDRGVG